MFQKNNTNNVSKYFVSLALKVPVNFEVEVNAKSEKEALELALEKWDGEYTDDDIGEPLWDELELDIDTGKSGDIKVSSNGVYIEKVK